MLELRWLQTGDGHEDSPIEITLQFRVRQGPRGEDWWGDWQNVPVVDQQGTSRSWGGGIKT